MPSTSPSRGSPAPSNPTIPPPDASEAALSQQSTTAYTSFRRNLTYFLHPTSTSSTTRPTRLRTRALLRSLHYLTEFLLWRLVRWAKYAAVAALAATAFGSVVSGAAWVVAPTGIGASVAAMGVWGVGRWVARRAHGRWRRRGGDEGVKLREGDGVEVGMVAGRGLGTQRLEGAAAVPW